MFVDKAMSLPLSGAPKKCFRLAPALLKTIKVYKITLSVNDLGPYSQDFIFFIT
jgi:hypothetical protein